MNFLTSIINSFKSSKNGGGQESGKPFHVLTMGGGGIFCLYSARILYHLENKWGKPAGSKFDLVAGTSMGSINALAVSLEIPAEKVIKTFLEYGSYIFETKHVDHHTKAMRRLAKSSGLGPGLIRSRFDPFNLKSLSEALLGRETVLGSATYPVMVMAYDVSSGCPRIFSSTPSKPQYMNDLSISVSDLVLASGALPVLFPVHTIGEHRYVDGSVFASSPDLVAFRETLARYNVPTQNVKMVSLGSMMERFHLPEKLRNDLGVLSWASGNRLPTLMQGAQQQFTTQFMSDILGDNYLRIDSHAQDFEGSIDSTSTQMPDMIRILSAADKTWKKLEESGTVNLIARD